MVGYTITRDNQKLDFDFIHPNLCTVVQIAINYSLYFGVSTVAHEPIRFARVLTDYTILFYLMAVFIADPTQKKGFSRFIMEYIMNHPELQGFQRCMLATHAAQGFYSKFGFEKIKNPKGFMEIVNKPS